MRLTGNSSIILISALVWQFVLGCLSGNLVAARADENHLTRQDPHTTQQLSMVEKTLPFLVESKRQDIAKREPPSEQFSATQRAKAWSFFKLSTAHSVGATAGHLPFRRGFWLINRELLL